ncbi:CinA family protein [Denitromonas ohlonensis]|jgi:nicotinamide-nucleotide amidase|uniref:CinA family protein n=3 Tax=Denitromonas TaxID=139331 RepID=A0A557SDV7_9RHOO|nr:CinA family protein [Denitromonas ohlonensis]TVO75615.1 CinA family protein [Denitromonas ohlonensis]
MDAQLDALARRTGHWLLERGWRLATAESCTGGWIAETVTAIAGSSDWFDSGWVTYSNAAKMRQLDVPASALDTFGAVSEPVVSAMVQGALAHSDAQVAIAVSGVAGPSGGRPGKPVGTVCIAWGWPDRPVRTTTFHFDGDREQVRRQAVIHALDGLLLADTPANSVP